MKTIILEIENGAEDEISRVVQTWLESNKVRVKGEQQPVRNGQRPSDRFRGKLSHETAQALLKEIEEGREE